MNKRTRIAVRRSADAYRTLRGRPPKPDYGILVIFPFLAAAGGCLIALAVEVMIERRKARRPDSKISVPGTDRPGERMRSTLDRP